MHEIFVLLILCLVKLMASTRLYFPRLILVDCVK